MAFYSSWSFSSFVIVTFAFLVIISMRITNAQLDANYYSTSCPLVFTITRTLVQIAVTLEARMGASLLRMFFHDCFPNGCDGSILLDDNSTFTGEKTAGPNNNSVRGYEVIDVIKTAVEIVCPGVVSCADILAIVARDSVVALGGPTWSVLLGRRDSITPNISAASTNLPPPTFSVAQLIQSFTNQGLSAADLVALSGAHTIGQAHCVTFRDRIYNDTDIDASFAQEAQESCPSTSGSGDDNLSPLDVQTPTLFDNDYFNNLINLKGLLHSDQQLYSGGSTGALVSTYNSNATQFRIDFASAMIRMGNIQPLTGCDGEIRTSCRTTN